MEEKRKRKVEQRRMEFEERKKALQQQKDFDVIDLTMESPKHKIRLEPLDEDE